MVKIKEKIERIIRMIPYKARRKKFYEKNIKVIRHYGELTTYEFIIEYTEKKAKYEFQRNFLIGSVITALLAVFSGTIKNIYLPLFSILKNSFGTGDDIVKVTGILSSLVIMIFIVLMSAFVVFIWFCYKNTREMYRDLLILEELKTGRRKNEVI